MATLIYTSGAPFIARVVNYLFAGTWTSADVIQVTVGEQTYSFTTGSATIATFLDSLVTALNAIDSTNYAAIAEQSASRSTATLSLTARTAGKPFSCTIATNSVAGTIDGAASSTGSVFQSGSSPYDWSMTQNFSTLAVPVNGDTVIIDRPGTKILYELDQSGVTLAELRILSPDVEIGLPKRNEDNSPYDEYRTDYLSIGATLCYIQADQTQRLKINFGTVQTSCTLAASGSGAELDVPAVLLKGTHASNVWNMQRGQFGIGFFAGEAYTIATMTQGQKGGGDGDSVGVLGFSGTIGSITKSSGTLVVNSAIATKLVQLGGTTTINGVGAVAQLTIMGGGVVYNTTGTLGGNTIVADGVLDFSQDDRAKTITNPVTVKGAGSFLDSARVVNVGGTYELDLDYTTGGTFDFGPDRKLVISNLH